jgi:hypothetical protein
VHEDLVLGRLRDHALPEFARSGDVEGPVARKKQGNSGVM